MRPPSGIRPIPPRPSRGEEGRFAAPEVPEARASAGSVALFLGLSVLGLAIGLVVVGLLGRAVVELVVLGYEALP